MLTAKEIENIEKSFIEEEVQKLLREYKALRFMRQDPKTPQGYAISVHRSDVRFKKAEQQKVIAEGKKAEEISKETILKYVKEFLGLLGMKTEGVISKPVDQIDYSTIKVNNELSDIRDIVWMKFTSEGYLCTVACSNDINLSYVPDGEDPDKKENNGHYTYNTSAVILKRLSLKWDDEVLVIPLKNIPDGLKRGDIEAGIGNYLIYKEIPILDYYSHNY